MSFVIDFDELMNHELYVIFCAWYNKVEGQFPYWIKQSDRKPMLDWIESEFHPDVRKQRRIEETKKKKYHEDVLLSILDNMKKEDEMKFLIGEYECEY